MEEEKRMVLESDRPDTISDDSDFAEDEVDIISQPHKAIMAVQDAHK